MERQQVQPEYARTVDPTIARAPGHLCPREAMLPEQPLAESLERRQLDLAQVLRSRPFAPRRPVVYCDISSAGAGLVPGLDGRPNLPPRLGDSPHPRAELSTALMRRSQGRAHAHLYANSVCGPLP